MTYTTHPNERETKLTVPPPGDVVELLYNQVDGLRRDGARVLTAQFLHETGGGKFCFNWNLGNVKAATVELHMYLRNVWEVLPESSIPRGGRVASPEECRQRGWRAGPGQHVVVFDPPHSMARFRAYESLERGAAKWIAYHAQQGREYIEKANAGDVAGVAGWLKSKRYYTGVEADYAAGMRRWLAQVPA